MNDFYIKYYSDEDFRNFIDELIDPNSKLWEEYRFEKSYELLSLRADEIREGLYDVSFMKEPIDEMIEYFLAKEEYEKCKDLEEIKKYLKQYD